MLYQRIFKISQVVLTSTLPIACLTLASTAAEAFSFSNLYVFGDSLSDTGNAYQATFQTFPPPPYAAGKLSNGDLWVQYLAPKLGIPFQQSTNFAVAGSTTGTDNTVPIVLANLSQPGLQGQISQFTQQLQQQNTQADPNALYIVWAGANDYLGAKITNPLDPTPGKSPINNLTQAIQNLIGVGAKNILVTDLPDLGKLPAVNQDSQTSAALTALTSFHNSLLVNTIDLLRASSPNVKLITYDVASLFSDAIANKSKYGFTNVTDACLDLVQQSICANPQEYLFWDPIHPTTTAHEFIAESAFQTIQAAEAVPEPSVTLGIATFGLLLAGSSAVQRRQRQLK